MEKPGRLQSMGPWRVGHDFTFTFPPSCIGEGNGNSLQCSCLENPRDGESGGLPSMGSQRVGHDWSDLTAAKQGDVGYYNSISRWKMYWMKESWARNQDMPRFSLEKIHSLPLQSLFSQYKDNYIKKHFKSRYHSPWTKLKMHFINYNAFITNKIHKFLTLL